MVPHSAPGASEYTSVTPLTLRAEVYMITGPPGVGKSEFTIWIAGQLGVPVYRLCLSSPRLSDDRLAQLFSQSSISFNSILVQAPKSQNHSISMQRQVKCES